MSEWLWLVYYVLLGIDVGLLVAVIVVMCHRPIVLPPIEIEWELTSDYDQYPRGYRVRIPGENEWRG